MFSLNENKAFVRLIVEYASVIWSPYTSCDITTLEAVQCKVARLIFNDFSSNSRVLAMINKNSLEDRRKQAKLIMVYKIIHGIVQVNFNSYLHLSRRGRGHQQNYGHLLARINSYHHSFCLSLYITGTVYKIM